MDAESRRRLQEALTRLADGDRSAFHPVFAESWPVVRAFTRALLRGAPDADDAAQEALLRVFSRASEFDAGRDALSWALGVAAWQIRTVRTRTRRRREDGTGALRESADLRPSPEDEAVGRDASAALDRMLAELSPADAATLLAYARGERPDLPAPTFRKRVERALRRLRSLRRIDHERF